jgi:hypothetical protein
LQILKGNPAFDAPREKLISYFSRGDLFFTADYHLCFVCGAATDTIPLTGERSLRAIFVEHIRAAADSKILCIRAETAATELLRQLEERRGSNTSQFEKVIAETVDSVLIFPESPGSFAELGFFSAYEDIAEKTLVAIKVEHQGNSFITLGPIHLIAKASQYHPVPFSLGKDPAAQMPDIVTRLLGESVSKRPYRNRFVKQPWKEYAGRPQLAILDEIVDLAGALTEADLLQIVHDSFGPYDVSRIRLLLSLLVATGRVVRNENGDIFATRRTRTFIECEGSERIAVIAKWESAYKTHFPDVIEQLAVVRL